MTWNEQIKNERLRRKLTQKQAASLFFLTERNYRHIEAATHFVRRETLDAIYKEWGLKVTYPCL